MSLASPSKSWHAKWACNREEIVKLASNENPLGPSPKAVAAMRDALDRAHFYPDGGGWALRTAIAESSV